jgi:hypothetical protein
LADNKNVGVDCRWFGNLFGAERAIIAKYPAAGSFFANRKRETAQRRQD